MGIIGPIPVEEMSVNARSGLQASRHEDAEIRGIEWADNKTIVVNVKIGDKYYEEYFTFVRATRRIE